MYNFADQTEYATLNCSTGGALDITTVSDDAEAFSWFMK